MVRVVDLSSLLFQRTAGLGVGFGRAENGWLDDDLASFWG